MSESLNTSPFEILRVIAQIIEPKYKNEHEIAF